MQTAMRRIPDEFLLDIPDWLAPAAPPATDEELHFADEIRRSYLFDNHPSPFMRDAVRAFRLAAGASTYLEIGTFDKGNLAYVSTLLADDAVIIDVDIDEQRTRSARLERSLTPDQKLETIVGDSMADETVDRVQHALEGRPLDALFIDGNHIAGPVLSDFALYGRFVRPGGVILFHDALMMQGGQGQPGVAQALLAIDRVRPVYLIQGAETPIHRYVPYFGGDTHWGVFGVLRKDDRG